MLCPNRDKSSLHKWISFLKIETKTRCCFQPKKHVSLSPKNSLCKIRGSNSKCTEPLWNCHQSAQVGLVPIIHAVSSESNMHLRKMNAEILWHQRNMHSKYMYVTWTDSVLQVKLQFADRNIDRHFIRRHKNL